MTTLGIDNKLEMFWEGFPSGTDAFMGNFDPCLLEEPTSLDSSEGSP